MKRPLSFFFIAALAVAGCQSADSFAPIEGSLRPEHKFTLKTIDGKTIKLDEALKTHKAVLINFFATWCPPCQEEMPDLNRLHDEKKALGFTVLGVDAGDSAKQVAAFIQEYSIVFPVGLDGDQSVTRLYGVVGIPTTLLVASDGKVLGTYHGFTTKLVADVEKALK